MPAVYLALCVGLLTVFLLAASSDLWVQSLGIFGALGALLYLTLKATAARRQVDELHRLRAAYEQLDQQAKLIIRTDLELHHAQEELDRRLASLMSLHQLGRQLQVSLRPDEVFEKLDAAVVSNFGFATGLLGLCTSFEAVEWRSLIGVSPDAAERIKTHLMTSGLLKQMLTDPVPHTLQATANPTPSQDALLRLLGVSSVVIAGIIPHSGPAGCLVLGRPGGGLSASKADEELVAVLANQLVIAVENSALYEQSWNSQQDLERKIQERTRELASLNAELLRLNKAKSDFVSAVSHELRTPLAAIKGYAALLGGGQFGTLAPAQAERIAKIEKHADLLTQLINNLLDIARIESGRVTMEQRAIPVEEFLATIQDTVHPQLQAKRIRFAIDRNGITELVGDPQHLARVFVNLLSNAVKYTPEGGSIRLALQQDGGVIFATVSDTGCGIPQEDLPKLFQEFYRVNDPINQEVRGTGLGLVLVKRIVEAHRGRIAVTSEKGKGTTVTVQLPAQPAAAS